MSDALTETILSNFGVINCNNLLNIVQDVITDVDLDTFSINPSPYYTYESFVQMVHVHSAQHSQHLFPILSLNCQSLNAKFDQIQIFIDYLKTHGFCFSAICLQETWMDNDSDLSLFQIPGYTCISNGRSCTQHGGLIIYLHEQYNFFVVNAVNTSEIFEMQIIKLDNQLTKWKSCNIV